MRCWTPKTLYGMKPLEFIVAEGQLRVGMRLWSLWAVVWTVLRGLLCLSGAALASVGGAAMQMRQDYRANSKWRRRDAPP